MKKQSFICAKLLSLPVREVWIEIPEELERMLAKWSLPVREVWIEIENVSDAQVNLEGHFPWGKCGLKYNGQQVKGPCKGSLPVREVWIEMLLKTVLLTYVPSLPVREVWIEIKLSKNHCIILLPSLPVREVWIEIHRNSSGSHASLVTSREGSVDWNIKSSELVGAGGGHFPWGKCGLKYIAQEMRICYILSLPVRGVWIEIML